LILTELSKSENIKIASTTMNITAFPPVDFRKDSTP